MPAGVNPGRAVHMMDIHAERGLQCADCHFAQDSHGNGFIYGEVANAVEIGCRDCHGTARDYRQSAHLRPGRAAARPNLEPIRNEDGRRRFEWVTCERARDEVPAIECSRRAAHPAPALDRRSEPRLGGQPGPRQRRSRRCPPATSDGERPTEGPCFNQRSARAKLMARAGAETGRYLFGPGVPDGELAHPDNEMACFTCHLSGRRAAAAATCRSRRTGARPPTITKARRRATSRPTTRRSRATTCSSSAATRPARAISSPRSARPRR